jgi:hypothetical protein
MAGQRVVRVSPKVLANLLGLPEDAVLEGASTHLFFDSGDVALRFHSGQWADRVPGDVIPEIRVESEWGVSPLVEIEKQLTIFGAIEECQRRMFANGIPRDPMELVSVTPPEHTDCGFVDPPATPDDTPHIIIGD